MRFWLGCLLALALPQTATAQARVEVTGVEIVTFGIYQTKRTGETADAKQATGKITHFNAERVLEETTEICPRLGEVFGIEYRPLGAPSGAAVRIQTVVRYPSPGLVNPSGNRFTEGPMTFEDRIGETAVRAAGFDEIWQIVPGNWVFEVFHEGRKLAKKTFHVKRECPGV